MIEVRSAVSNLDLNQMSKQRLSVTISTKNGQSVSGLVRTRSACELFHSPLSNPSENQEADNKISGMAWMYVDKVGALKYHVRLDGIAQPDMLGLGELKFKTFANKHFGVKFLLKNLVSFSKFNKQVCGLFQKQKNIVHQQYIVVLSIVLMKITSLVFSAGKWVITKS